ncbi:MAG TPA: ABC transporter permease [Thermoanaerobaculia bacterium]|nr:ABC transporter permease [Thermoanaerobaculia bacterium]
MIVFENFAIALRALKANTLRSILTTLGIIIGTGAVIAVVSIIQGLQAMIIGEFQGSGATMIMVFPNRPERGERSVAKPVRLTLEDAEAIATRVPGVARLSPVMQGRATALYADREHGTQVLGVNEYYPDIANQQVERGRFFSTFDLEQRRKVAVIGREVLDELRIAGDPIGKEISLGQQRATVIGVLEKQGQTLGRNRDDLIYVPFPLGLTLFGKAAAEQVSLEIDAQSVEVVEQVQDGVRQLLRQRHGLVAKDKDDFHIFIQDQFLRLLSRFLGGVTAVVAGVVSVSLLVGGIGIMNIMLVSVTERTREIGVRKAVGGRKRDILLQFLIESVSLSLVGGAIGILLGYGLGALVVGVVPYDLPPPKVPIWAVMLAFGFSSIVGVVFGLYPAAKAARLDPIEALRYE